MDKPILLWFRQDLRLQDHPALEAALQMKRKVIPLFIWSTEVSGFASIGAASKVWLHESLKSLDAQLQNRGSKLLFRTGRPIEVLKELVEQTGATTLLWGRQYEPDSILRDTEIKQFFRAKGLTVHSFNTNLIVEPWKLKTQSGSPYRVFTPFWRACERVACEEMALQAPSVPEEIPGPQNWPNGCFLNELGLIPQGQLDHNGESWHEVMLKNWQPGEPGAQLQLQKFLHQSLQGYQKDRDLPSISGSSRLSPHLHFGEISPKRLFQEF